jgi:hypothetical protein
MAKKDTLHPWQQIEEQAFHSFREWPLWLVLRQRELAQQTSRTPSRPSPTAGTGNPIGQPKGN